MSNTLNDRDRWRWVALQQLESYRRAGLEIVHKTPADWAAALDAFATAHPSIESDASAPTVVETSRPSRFTERPIAPPPPRTHSRPSATTGLDSRSPDTPLPDSSARMASSLPPFAAPPRPHQEPDVAKRVSPASRTVDLGHGTPSTDQERIDALQVVKCEVEQCARCPVLAQGRTQTVFGVGNVRPRVVFFGEAPGADEDRQGEPFVGRAGQLLTKIIEACTFRREDVYILNVLKCRPPDNRTPTEEETENCRPFFERQLEILKPEYIVCVGAVPTQALLKSKTAIGKMRQKFHTWNNTKVVVTYHPAYLLRNPDAKKFVWDDMKMMLADMGIELPKRT